MPGGLLLGPISQTVVVQRKSSRKGCVKGEDIYLGSWDSEMIEGS